MRIVLNQMSRHRYRRQGILAELTQDGAAGSRVEGWSEESESANVRHLVVEASSDAETEARAGASTARGLPERSAAPAISEGSANA